MPMPKHLEGKAVSIMNQPNRGKGAGRKPKLVKKWIKQTNLSKKDAQAILLYFLSHYTITELDQLVKSECDQQSVLTFSFMKEIIVAGKKGDFSVTKQMLEFIWGKDEQPIHVRDDARLVDLRNLLLEQAEASPEERERIIAELERATGNAE
jgi:hypothetical protein